MRQTQIISFDMDGTLTRSYVQSLLKRHLAWGDEVHIVTSRNPIFDNLDLFQICDEYEIPKHRVHFTNQQLKLDTLLKINVNIHYDDDLIEVDDINTNGGGTIAGILIGYIHRYK